MKRKKNEGREEIGLSLISSKVRFKKRRLMPPFLFRIDCGSVGRELLTRLKIIVFTRTDEEKAYLYTQLGSRSKGDLKMIVLGIGAAAFIATFLGGLFALRFKDKLHLITGFSAGAIIGVAFFRSPSGSRRTKK